VRLPRSAELVARRDGALLACTRSATLDLDLIGPGVYRVEARIDGRFWLCSNPVRLD
jgi:hypothetical protein